MTQINWTITRDQATRRYTIRVPSEPHDFFIQVEEEYGLIELMEFCCHRNVHFFTSLGEPLLVNYDGNISCTHPDPWLNKEHTNGLPFICDAEDLAAAAAGALKEFIDGRFSNTGS